MMSVCPQAGHGNNPPGNSVFDAVAAMVQGVGYLELPTPLMWLFYLVCKWFFLPASSLLEVLVRISG